MVERKGILGGGAEGEEGAGRVGRGGVDGEGGGLCCRGGLNVKKIYTQLSVPIPFTINCNIQPVSYKKYFRCNNCFLLLVYTINLSLSTDLVDPPPMGTFYMKHALR